MRAMHARIYCGAEVNGGLEEPSSSHPPDCTIVIPLDRAEENAESARSAIYAIFWLIASILTFRDKSTVF